MIQMIKITSKDNRILKHVRQLSKRNYREKSRQYIIEGKRLVMDGILNSNTGITNIIVSNSFCATNNILLTPHAINDCADTSGSYSEHTQKMPSFDSKIKNFISRLDELGIPLYTVEDKLFDDICRTETPQGILAVANMPKLKDFIPHEHNFILILDGVSEPGNMGTILRTAEAAGIDGVILMKGCTDIYNPKTARSAMGTLFRMPVFYMENAFEIEKLKQNGFRIMSTTLDDAQDIYSADFRGKTAIVIGNEANGVSKEIIDISTDRIKIDMDGQIESLNAAVAAGIVMFEAKRRRLSGSISLP